MSEAPASGERRAHQRHAVSIRAHVAQLGEVEVTLASDLSEGGLILQTSFPYPVGACVPLRFIHPRSAEQIPVVCEVVRHIEREGGGLAGLAMRLTDADPGLAERLRGLIEAAEQPAAPPPPPPPPDAVAGEQEVASDGVEAQPETADGQAEAPGLLELVPADAVVVPDIEADREGLHPMLLHLLSFVDGALTADQVAVQSGLSLVEALAGLHELSRRQMVELVAPQRPAGPAEAVELSEEEQQAQYEFAQQKARECLAEAVRAERAGRIGEAVSLMEQALALHPANAVDIHVRLARMSMGPLANVQLARKHIAAIRALEPESGDLPQLEIELPGREKELAAARKARKAPSKPRVVPSLTAGMSKTRRVIAAVAAVSLLALVGWNVWVFAIPHGPRPEEVDLRRVEALIPATRARVFEKRLYLTVGEAWKAMDEAAKTKALQRVAAWTLGEHGAREVVVSDSQPVLVGRVRGKAVTLYE